MARLTEELAREHANLMATLHSLGEMGGSDPRLGNALAEARQTLVAHVAREDSELYGPLTRAAQSNPALNKTLTIFTHDLESLTRSVLEFFERYENGGETGAFHQDFQRMCESLRTRVRREETLLFPEFDALGA